MEEGNRERGRRGVEERKGGEMKKIRGETRGMEEGNRGKGRGVGRRK